MTHLHRAAALAAFAVAAVTAGCSSGTTSSLTSPANSAPAAAGVPVTGALATSRQAAETLDRLVAPPGWTLSLWAVGGGKYSNPDAIELDGQNIWVGYQNKSVKDGSDNSKTSTIVEYTLDGKVVNTWAVPGHTDGLRVDPATHRAWVTSNEDGGAVLEIIDPTNPTPQVITLPATPHGGGLDDLAFLGGATYIARSNPTLDAIYTIRWSGPKGSVFTEAPNDSGVAGFIGTIDMTTGFITPSPPRRHPQVRPAAHLHRPIHSPADG